MTDNAAFPSKELLEVIRGQARMEEKLDSFIRGQSDLREKVEQHGKDIAELKSDGIRSKAYVAGAGSVAGVGMSFLVPYLKSKLGL